MFSNDDLVSLTLTCTGLKILQDILVKNLLKWSVKSLGGGVELKQLQNMSQISEIHLFITPDPTSLKGLCAHMTGRKTRPSRLDLAFD